MSTVVLPPTPGTTVEGEPTLTAAQKRRRGMAAGDPGSPAGRIAGYAAMVLAALVFLLPLYFIVITSLKTHGDIYSNPISWIPEPFVPGNYVDVFNNLNFGMYLRNSLIITSVLTVVEVTLGVLSAYGFAFLRFPGRDLLFVLVIGSLMVPNQITIISNYALVAQWGWRNTFIGIIVPLAGVAFGTFLMRNHFLSLPTEIMEAAEMDHAGFFRTLFKVVLPMSWPTLSAFVLITVVTEWNQYLWPFLIANDDSVIPLPIGLTQLQDAEGMTNWGPVMAGTVITTIPMLIVFALLQKQMIKGLTAGAVKG
ncbi:carbohydrate ABC transporter permease [Brachybacterium muris]|uniref:carbohydrate ABC transporter permease n=1 Tax=Brachybacterium muris TaxID=219301 RepID=UPI00223A7A9C|nr:carbohydrate ABC transporter permease [Brachybacterium muris]MCT1653234.1 carbohydrate ABC transporter permease [Brachybacterium muris]MCT2261551.1 carbohydrate ABC transporter permease [Brachybacterium muris]MCT2294573.1 carbohydrate ABC transporter permease [Brachybacterium muris]